MANDHQKKINYQVDGEHQSTTEATLSPAQIMSSAGIDPQANFLEQLKGHDIISFKDQPTQPITMEDGMRFLTKPFGPMPVS